MKNQWRLLLLRRHSTLLASNICRTFAPSLHQVKASPSTPISNSLSAFSLLHLHTTRQSPLASPFPSPAPRFFSSEPAVDHKVPDHSVVIDVFSKSTSGDEIMSELESNSITITHQLVFKVLRNLESSPVVGIKFFDWISERENDKLTSKSYNSMLRILGVNGLVKEFWDMVEVMKKKCYGLSKNTFLRVSGCFESEGLQDDLEKLRGLYHSNTGGSSVEKISKIVREEVWDEDVERKIQDLDVVFTSNLVKVVLENVGTDPMKALIFFRWVEESGLYKHDAQTYNAMALVLGREHCLDRFWNVLGEMRNAGYEMEMGTFVKVLNVFVGRKMLKDAVDLYEYAMKGANVPSVRNFAFLLKKVVVSKEFDMELFSKVVKIFTDSGNVLPNTTLDAVWKSLTSVGRLGELAKILEVLVEAGLKPSPSQQGKIAFQLSGSGGMDEAFKELENLEASGCSTDYRSWIFLVERYCAAGELDKAEECLRKLVDKEGPSSARYPLEVFIKASCDGGQAIKASEILSGLVTGKGLEPSHSTYKTLISKLSKQNDFGDALKLLPLMKNHGFPPYLDPLIEYVVMRGTPDEAVLLLKGMTTKKSPDSAVYLRIFEAYFLAQNHDGAQSLLAKCTRCIKNNSDVLYLFHSMKSKKIGTTGAIAA